MRSSRTRKENAGLVRRIPFSKTFLPFIDHTFRAAHSISQLLLGPVGMELEQSTQMGSFADSIDFHENLLQISEKDDPGGSISHQMQKKKQDPRLSLLGCSRSQVPFPLSKAENRTRCSVTIVFPVPGLPLINSTPGLLLIKVRRRRVGTFPHPFGPQLRAQLTAAPKHLGSWLSRFC